MRVFENLDTVYVGLETDMQTLYGFLEEINKYLFIFFHFRNRENNSRNRFYVYEIDISKYGCMIYYEPRKGLKNDYCTVQLSGEFFRYAKESRQFLEALFEFFPVHRFQRVDVRMDVIYGSEEYKNLEENISHFQKGFPIPEYNPEWKNRKVNFEFYGRAVTVNNFYFNMVANSKGYFRLRVYDKDLDLKEVKNCNYKNYYFLDKSEDVARVFRIEGQFRGDGLRNLLELKDTSYDGLIKTLKCYLLKKFVFRYYSEDYKCDCGSLYKKRIPDIKEQILYNKKMIKSYYKKLQECMSSLNMNLSKFEDLEFCYDD